MNNEAQHLKVAHEALAESLEFLEQILDVFSTIIDLGIDVQAKDIMQQAQAVASEYFWETWESSGGLPGLDAGFSELQEKMDRFSSSICQFEQSVDRLKHIHTEFVLAQAIVMLVSSLEVYLRTLFISHLSRKYDERVASDLACRYNFQNWGSSVEAYRRHLQIELCPPGTDGSRISDILQKRHVFVHQTGALDERAIRQLRLALSSAGDHLSVTAAEVKESIELVRGVAEHIDHEL